MKSKSQVIAGAIYVVAGLLILAVSLGELLIRLGIGIVGLILINRGLVLQGKKPLAQFSMHVFSLWYKIQSWWSQFR